MCAELVEGLRAQIGERAPRYVARSDIGSSLKTYDRVPAGCPAAPVRCSGLEIERVSQLDLASRPPARYQIRRRPGCRPRGCEIPPKPKHSTRRVRHPVVRKAALGDRILDCLLDIGQLRICVLGPQTQQIAACSQRSDSRPCHSDSAGGTGHIQGVADDDAGEAQLSAQ